MYGAENLSNEELLSIILKTGSKNCSVKEVSLNLLANIKNINKLKDIGISTLTNIDGIGKVKAIELKAAIEIGKRVYGNNNNEKMVLKEPKDVFHLLKDVYKGKMQEHFYCIYLDASKKYIDKKCLFIGTLNMATIHPREIFKEAYMLSANYIICSHNHPSGEVKPSKQDIEMTRMIMEIGLLHGIKLLDHVIIGKDTYYSFNENGML